MKRKTILIGSLVVVILLAAIGTYMYFKPHVNMLKVKTDEKINALQLIDDFLADENQANKKYLGKIIEVHGEVVSITNRESGLRTIYLGDILHGVSCTLSAKQTLGDEIIFNQGDMLSIKGKCDGFLADVILTECIIVKKYE